MTINMLIKFIDSQTYDIRQTRNGRWIDQKCAFDAVSFVADCIVNYLDEGGAQPFQSPNIWHQDYSMEFVQAIFGKPNPKLDSTFDEYNKFFRQPMKMLSAAGILSERKEGTTIQFSVENMDALKFIALRERNSYDFLCVYIEKTLKDSGIWDSFASFFDEQTKERFDECKKSFWNFCHNYTPIGTPIEAGRIFAKVLNPLACKYRKQGTMRGRLSDYAITLDNLRYNKANFIDEYRNKDKAVARGDFQQPSVPSYSDYMVARAIKNLRKFNDTYNNGRSEVTDILGRGPATHMHHIFPKSQYQKIASYMENLIALTSGQHLQEAHPNGNTQIVDKDFQYTCLICKADNIRRNLMGNTGEEVIYNFNDFMYVLDVGLSTNYFEGLPENDFTAVLSGIDINYT